MIERKRLEKEKYTIEGEIDKAGVLFKKYTYAYSGAQAKTSSNKAWSRISSSKNIFGQYIDRKRRLKHSASFLFS